ncbi:MAG TPA: endo-1,4-beta-xylanase [Blastocatellia bacterium]|nr:endo-1,4-beta-xylanase [Blastocatellia bacterium]
MLLRINLLALFILAVSLSIVVEAQPLRDAADNRGLRIGAAVNMTPFGNEPIYTQTLAREFNMLVAENAFKFDALHTARNTYNFTNADALMAFAEANNMAVRGHALVWHSQIPGWLTGGNFTRDDVIAIMRDHILTVVGRYRGRILAWDVVNEAVSDNNGQLRTDSFWHQRIGPEYIAMAFQFAREADPNAILYYNDYSIEGSGAKSDAVFNLVSGLVNQGAPIDGVGWQMHQINPFRIQQAHRNNAQRLATLGLEISITEMDVRISLPTTAQELQEQALAYGDATEFCLSQPNCKALVTWGFTDKYSWVPGFFSGFGDALIFDANYQPKPAYFAIQSALLPPAGPLPAPTGLAATAGNAQVQLSWNASAGATSYNVKRATTSGGPYTTVASVSSPSFTNMGLTNGTTYFYVVSAVGANVESANSSQVSATPLAASFTLAANPSTLTINRGASGTSSITITRSGGFSASIALTASGLPSGVTATFNPSSTTGTSSVLTLTASSSAALGIMTVTVTGAGGGLTRAAQLTLTVNQAPDISVSANPSSLTVNRGASVSTTISVTRIGGFTSSVSFSASGLPSGVTASFNPPSTTGTSSALTLMASSAATVGAATITITATGGGLTRTSSISLTVTDPGSGTGGVTVTPGINANNPWYNEEVVRLNNPNVVITSLSVTIVIQRTPGVSFNGHFNTVGGQILMSSISSPTTITYQFTLASGQTLGTGANRTFAAQVSGTGTIHPTSGDTYTVTYTTGGVSYTQTGHF